MVPFPLFSNPSTFFHPPYTHWKLVLVKALLMPMVGNNQKGQVNKLFPGVGEWPILIMLFYCPCFWHLDIWGFAGPGETPLPRVSQFLEIVNDWPSRMPFICQLTNLQPTPTTSSIGVSHSGPLSICPNHPRAGTRWPQTAGHPRACWNFSN